MANSTDKLFAGAGIVVCKPGTANHDSALTLVETEHAEEVSELIFELKDVFAGEIDYFDKHEFYGRLADAANRGKAAGDDLASMKAAIIDEAKSIASEMGGRQRRVDLERIASLERK